MRLARKLAVALSVLVTGAGAALLFRKDARPGDESRQRALENPFRQRVERRVPVGAAWAHKIGASRAAERVPPIATASISRSQSPPGDEQPTFQKTLNPVGSLLEPIDGVPPGDDEPTSPLDVRPSEIADGETRTHTVVDGDTLTRLAIQYLGRAEGYAEIFALNRDILSNPDLLPIGARLRIPPRRAPAAPEREGTPTVEIEGPRAVDPPGQRGFGR
jgi:nucleoid-associated protein YgaU